MAIRLKKLDFWRNGSKKLTLAAVAGAAGETWGELSTLAEKQRRLSGFLYVLAHGDGEDVTHTLLHHRRFRGMDVFGVTGRNVRAGSGEVYADGRTSGTEPAAGVRITQVNLEALCL